MRKSYDQSDARTKGGVAANASYAAGFTSVMAMQGYRDGSAAARSAIDAKLENQPSVDARPDRDQTRRLLADTGRKLADIERGLDRVRKMLAPAVREKAASPKTTLALGHAAHALNTGPVAPRSAISSIKARLAAEFQEPEHSLRRALHEANAGEIKRLDARQLELRKARK